jgi:hypothetical protein
MTASAFNYRRKRAAVDGAVHVLLDGFCALLRHHREKADRVADKHSMQNTQMTNATFSDEKVSLWVTNSQRLPEPP